MLNIVHFQSFFLLKIVDVHFENIFLEIKTTLVCKHFYGEHLNVFHFIVYFLNSYRLTFRKLCTIVLVRVM